MEQSLLDRNLEEVSESLEVLEAQPAVRVPSYHSTPWILVNQILDIVDDLTGGRAGLCQKFFSFAVVGGFAALVNLAFYYVFLHYVPIAVNNFTIHDALANAIAFEISVIANFIPNDRFTFRHEAGRDRPWLARCIRFNITCIGGGILTYLFHEAFMLIHLWPFFAQAAALIVVMFYNFTFHHFFTYGKVKAVNS